MVNFVIWFGILGGDKVGLWCIVEFMFILFEFWGFIEDGIILWFLCSDGWFGVNGIVFGFNIVYLGYGLFGLLCEGLMMYWLLVYWLGRFFMYFLVCECFVWEFFEFFLLGV